jgi:PadR family transcriptional regulator PadR
MQQSLPLDRLKEHHHLTGRLTLARRRSDLLLGTLEMMVLKALAAAPTHGWGLSLRIEQITAGVFQINQGSLYPALQRMLRKGWVRSEWRSSENNRRARYYLITVSGRHRLEREMVEWAKVTGAVNQVLAFDAPEVR